MFLHQQQTEEHTARSFTSLLSPDDQLPSPGAINLYLAHSLNKAVMNIKWTVGFLSVSGY